MPPLGLSGGAALGKCWAQWYQMGTRLECACDACCVLYGGSLQWGSQAVAGGMMCVQRLDH